VTSHRVVASAGTYHLPFDRFSDWLQRWFDGRPDVDLVVQHGPSKPVRGATNVEILPYDELLDLCRDADVVVLQGGAGAVMDMRAIGRVPLVIPRVPGAGEVVDDHQLVFTAEMEHLGIIRRAITFEEFAQELDAMLVQPSDDVVGEMDTPGVEAIRSLMEQPIRKLPWFSVVGRGVRLSWELVGARLTRRAR